MLFVDHDIILRYYTVHTLWFIFDIQYFTGRFLELAIWGESFVYVKVKRNSAFVLLIQPFDSCVHFIFYDFSAWLSMT